jgi:hypothetical protein
VKTWRGLADLVLVLGVGAAAVAGCLGAWAWAMGAAGLALGANGGFAVGRRDGMRETEARIRDAGVLERLRHIRAVGTRSQRVGRFDDPSTQQP